MPEFRATEPVPEASPERMDSGRAWPTLTAHRGSSAEAPENTLAAIRLAIQDGADICEIDVLQAGDGTLVVAHDSNFERVAGVDLDVWKATAEQIAELEAGSHFGEAFRGEPIPTLDQVLEATQGKIRLNLELKSHGHERGFAEAVIAAVRRHDLTADCVLTSMDVKILKAIRTLDPTLALGLIVTVLTGRESSLDVDLYCVEQKTATAEFIEQAHRDGRAVHIWTLNERADLERFVERGADSLITDVPRLAREILDTRRRAVTS